MTALQRASVGPRTQDLYAQLLRDLDQWVSRMPSPPRCEADWDSALASYMDVLFAEGASASQGQKMLAALLWREPWLGRLAGGRMSRCRQALRGWRRIQPPGARLPIPYPVVHAIAMRFFHAKQPEFALLTLVMVELYARPSEPFRLRGRDVVAPVPGAGPAHAHASVVLHPFEAGVPSKTHEFDEALLLDLPRQAALGEALVRLSQKRGPDQLLFTVLPADYFAALRIAEDALNLKALGALHPYRLRHTGASHDFASKARDMQSIQRRGRWKDKRSMRRYEKGGRLQELLQRLPNSVVTFAVRCEQEMPNVLRNRRLPLAGP